MKSWEYRNSFTFFSKMKRGLEKENLRVLPNGHLSQTPHPQGLGSALTHPYITTDYSEALLEFMTPPLVSMGEYLSFLNLIHQFVYSKLGEEVLWMSSMPCILEGHKSIPIAHYGTSNLGKLKHVYRQGLSYRYGRLMQSIAGIHYNFSLPVEFWEEEKKEHGFQNSLQDFISQEYFHLIRNFHRYSWLMVYLFGASPAADLSFFQGRPHALEFFDRNSLGGTYATSLRMSDLGYQNKVQSGLQVSYNNLDDYVSTLNRAVHTPHPDYQNIGLIKDGEHIQLSANLLQIENEFYGPIRPKRIIQPGERTSLALSRRGVEYIEVRSIDLNPFLPLGISEAQVRWMDTFLLYCLFQESPVLEEEEILDIQSNQRKVAMQGRRPGLILRHKEKTLRLQDWAYEIAEGMKPIAEILDKVNETHEYTKALEEQSKKVQDPALTPSAQVLLEMKNRKESFAEMTMRLSLQHKKSFLNSAVDKDKIREFEELASQSLEKQKKMEENDNLTFEEYLRHYFHE